MADLSESPPETSVETAIAPSRPAAADRPALSRRFVPPQILATLRIIQGLEKRPQSAPLEPFHDSLRPARQRMMISGPPHIHPAAQGPQQLVVPASVRERRAHLRHRLQFPRPRSPRPRSPASTDAPAYRDCPAFESQARASTSVEFPGPQPKSMAERAAMSGSAASKSRTGRVRSASKAEYCFADQLTVSPPGSPQLARTANPIALPLDDSDIHSVESDSYAGTKKRADRSPLSFDRITLEGVITCPYHPCHPCRRPGRHAHALLPSATRQS